MNSNSGDKPALPRCCLRGRICFPSGVGVVSQPRFERRWTGMGLLPAQRRAERWDPRLHTVGAVHTCIHRVQAPRPRPAVQAGSDSARTRAAPSLW